MTGQAALFDGALPERTLKFDPEPGILYLLPDETHICPSCRATEGQSWQCGEADFYEMYCHACGFDYGVSTISPEAQS